MDRQIDKYVDRQINRQIDRQLDRQIDTLKSLFGAWKAIIVPDNPGNP